jgi:hypothetical protein
VIGAEGDHILSEPDVAVGAHGQASRRVPLWRHGEFDDFLTTSSGHQDEHESDENWGNPNPHQQTSA